MTLTIAFNHTVAVIAHIAKELDNREITSFDVYRAMRGNYFFFYTLLTLWCVSCWPKPSIYLALFFLPGYNESRSTPTPSSHNADDRGKASHTWHTQNAVNKNKCYWGKGGETCEKSRCQRTCRQCCLWSHLAFVLQGNTCNISMVFLRCIELMPAR